MTGSCRRRAHLSAVLLMTAVACETFETGYFEDKVHRATQDIVKHRYGPPHKVQNPGPDREVWTYFDRGSGMSGFSGYGRGPVRSIISASIRKASSASGKSSPASVSTDSTMNSLGTGQSAPVRIRIERA